MPENLSQCLGVLGFFLASSAVTVQLLQYFLSRRRHKEARKEEVQVSLRYVIGLGFRVPALVVRIVNTGRVPVYLDAVQLVCGPHEPAVGDSVLSISLAQTVAKPARMDLGDDREYFLDVDMAPPHLDKLLTAPADHVHLVVRSKTGEINRLTGKEVLPYLEQLVNFRKGSSCPAQ